MEKVCPECGAPRFDGRHCRDMLAEIIGWEWEDPALAAKHFLTVASYNLQHSAQFEVPALDALKSGFVRHLDEGLSVSAIRRHHARHFEGSKRVLKPANRRPPSTRRWSMTIADVFTGGREDAAERVQTWAQAVRRDL